MASLQESTASAGLPLPPRYLAPQDASPSARNAEEQRLADLRSLQIVGTAPEVEFDDLAELAATICGTPVALLCLVEADRLWLKASIGLSGREAPRSQAFCHHAILGTEIFVVQDASQDPRFCNHPLVTGEMAIRFYASMPVRGLAGHNVGTLCVLDRIPRTLQPEQGRALQVLAAQVQTRFELRQQRLTLQSALQSAEAAKARAEIAEKRFQTFMDCGPFLAYIKDAHGRMLYYNQRLARHFRVSTTAMLNKTDTELWPEHLAASYREHDREVLREGHLVVSHEQTANPDGSVSTWRSFKFPCKDVDGDLLLGGVSVEITDELRREQELKRYQAELETANQQLNELACLDALTGLANRRVFDEQLRIHFRQARQENASLAVLMVDVDHFKTHNDLYGHAHGDEVLRRLASCMRELLPRASDLIARYGGEEFVVLLPETSAADAERLARKLLHGVRSREWPLRPVTVSVGVGSLHASTRDTRHLLSRADEALYAAKCAGRDRVVSYAGPAAGL